MISRTVVVASPVNLYTHPTVLFVKAADDSGIDVAIVFDGEGTDAASLLEIMILGVGHGSEVTLSTDDDNVGAVLDSLVELLSRDLNKE